jgi:phage terminase small subunit
MLDNVRHEKFAQGVANGLTVSEAYRQAGYSANTAEAGGSRLLRKVNIANRIQELKQQNAQKASVTQQGYIDILSNCLAGKVQLRADQLKAGELLAKACGWNEPDKLAISGATEFKVVIGGSSTNGKDGNG